VPMLSSSVTSCSVIRTDLKCIVDPENWTAD
jgi:hypothetical protein